MLAYNIRKHNIEKSDPVREILAKLDAKQSKTGLSLYNQGHSSSALNIPGGSPLIEEEKPFFPDLKVARKKAHNRITSYRTTFESSQQQTQTKKVTHRLPSNKVDTAANHTFPPTSFSHGIQKYDERIQQSCSIPDQQIDKDKMDININPFGYNRKTLAYQTRNINYVVEWPETWPFKITSFQRKRKPPLKDIKRPNQPKNVIQTQTLLDEEQLQLIRPLDSLARVLAPIDNPTKQQASSSKPYVESSAIKRGVRKSYSKGEEKQFELRSRGNDNEISSRKDDDALKREKMISLLTGNQTKGNNGSTESITEDFITQTLNSSPNSKLINPEISKERVDSVPPSTPVPREQDPPDDVPQAQEEPVEDPEEDEDPKSLLTDIVNQIVEESSSMTI